MDEETCGEMMDGTQDVALNFADVVGGMGQGKLENRELVVATNGKNESRSGNVGSLGDKGVCEEED